jgi:hypothetical protein
MVSQQIYHQQQPFGHPMPQQIDESAKQRYVEEERERLRMYEEQRRHQFPQGMSPTSNINLISYSI